MTSRESDGSPGTVPEREDPPKAEAPQQKRRVLLLTLVGALVLALLVVKLVVPPAKRGVGGLPPPIAPNMEQVSALAPPEPPGSPAEAAEIEELLSRQGQRTPAQADEATFWQKGAVLRWNEIAVSMISKYGTSPVMGSRMLTLVSIAQHDALLAVTREQRAHRRPAPSRVSPLFAAPAESTYPSEHAAVAAASAAVLSYVYANHEQKEMLAKRAKDHMESRIWAGVSRRSDVAAGERLGREVAAKLIAYAKTDRADKSGLNWRGEIPVGKDKWRSLEDPPVVPVRVLWNGVRPWLMTSPSQFRAPPPPSIDSPEFAAALDEVRQITKGRTPEQLRVAKFWGDSPGSPTPPGHWNQIAWELLANPPSSELRAARVFALMNMAVMDAGISCWDTKYTYWFIRPTHADATITLPVGLPNFPGYTSGHASFSGAAAEVLAHFFPAEKDRLTKMADEASLSRVYDGIHFRFDGQQGIAAGRAIGRLAIQKAESEAAVP
jgi:hypothetical protein